jgi:hypothetical protein
VGVAIGLGAAVLVSVALLSGSGTVGFAILGLAGAVIGGTYWWQSSRTKTAARELPPEAIAMSKGLTGVGEGVDVELRGPHENRAIRVALPFVVGRSAEAGLDVADELVSRRHALFELRAGEIWVQDLGSRNGTFVDGFPLTGAQPLPGGSVVTVGSTELTVRNG